MARERERVRGLVVEREERGRERESDREGVKRPPVTRTFTCPRWEKRVEEHTTRSLRHLQQEEGEREREREKERKRKKV